MKRQLQNYLTNLHQLRERLKELRADLEYVSSGHTIYYAADFSEVFAYLHSDEEDTIAVTLDPADYVKASNQHRLGLAHLFHTLAHAIYLLPPYTIEMWSYVRTQSDMVHSLSDLRHSTNKALQDLDESTKELLGNLNSDSELTEQQAQTLLSLIKDEFEKLSGDVSAFVTWNKRADALKNLLDNTSLSYVSFEVEEVLREQGVPADQLQHPSAAEEVRVFESFPDDAKWDKRYAKLVDARALVYLRDLNKLLEPVGAKMVLVTRDNSMRRAATNLCHEKWFGWKTIATHLRGIETLFFDLILRSTHHIHDKIKWIRESDLKLASMEHTVNEMLAKMHASDGSQYDTELATASLTALKSTSKLWDEHINLQLSLALSATPWLRDRFSDSFVRPTTTPVPSTALSLTESRNLKLLKNLWEFVSTPKYRDLAEEDAQAVWSELENETRRISFLGRIDTESVAQLSQILSEPLTGSRTVLLSMSALRMPAIQFVSKNYQVRLRTLQTYAKKGQESKAWMQKQFLPIVYDATSGISEPEDFLFMAFVLGMLEFWAPALAMAEHSLQISSSHEINRSEVYLFIAFAKRTLGKLETRIQKETEFYINAYKVIGKAISEKPDDPRFMLEQASIGLMYREAIKSRGSSDDSPGSFIPRDHPVLPDVSSAKELLRRALEIQRRRNSKLENDRRLIIDILNNLAYAEVLSDDPNFQKAKGYLIEIEAEFESSGSHRDTIFKSLRGRLDDTRIMIDASQAFYTKDAAALQKCLEELQKLCSQDYLSEPQLKVVQEHLSLIQKWIETLRDSSMDHNGS